MRGLILAAGRSQRLQELTDSRNKVLLDLADGKSILENLLDQFESAGVKPNCVVVGNDAPAVRTRIGRRASLLLNPFYEHFGILSSLWVARSEFYAAPFVVSVGDHYLEREAMADFMQAQTGAGVLLHVELKKCDDEDMKVFIDHHHKLETISKVWTSGTAIGEFSGLIRFSAQGSRLFFDCLADYAWSHGVRANSYMADVLMACHRSEALAFHLSSDHRRMDVDYPSDYMRARDLYKTRPQPAPTPAVAAPPMFETTPESAVMGGCVAAADGLRAAGEPVGAARALVAAAPDTGG